MANARLSVQLNTGAHMPLFGLGTWKSKAGQVELAVQHALSVGYRHIDCATCYGNEKEVGAALAASWSEGLHREDVFVTSKLWNTCHAPEDVRPGCEKTLADLGLAYLDLYLIHWPVSFQRGDNLFPKNEDGSITYDNTPLEETWKAMEGLVAAGLVKAIGVSNFNHFQIEDILAKGNIPPAVLQIESHPYLTQSKLIPFAQSKGIAVTAYSPLGSPDRPWAKPDDPKLLDDPKLKAVGDKYGKTAAQVAIRFQVQRNVVCIPKTVTPARIEENMAVFDFELSEEDMATVASFECGGRVCIPMIEDASGKLISSDGGHQDFPFHAEY